MLAPVLASGAATDDRIPTIESSNGPASFKGCQPFSCVTTSGTLSSGHTMDSSSSGLQLLDVAGGPRLRLADVSDEVRHLCGRGGVGRNGEHGVLARDGSQYFKSFHPVEDAGDGAGGSVAGVDNDLVLCWHEAEHEAREYLDTCGTGIVRQRQVAAPDLEDAQFGEVAAHGRLRDLDALVGERPDDVLLGAEVALGDQTQDQVLPRRLVHVCARRRQNRPPTRGARARGSPRNRAPGSCSVPPPPRHP